MITIRKLASLKESTRNRKILRILEEAEIAVQKGALPNTHYLLEVMQLLPKELLDQWSIESSEIPNLTTQTVENNQAIQAELHRSINALRHRLSQYLGATPGDWDFLENHSFTPQDNRIHTKEANLIGAATLYLDDIRSPFNVGSIFRTAHSFGVSSILYSQGTAAIDHPRTHKTARGTVEEVTHIQSSYENLLRQSPDVPIFALETGGTSLFEFEFPLEGVMIIGSEELGVAPKLLDLAKSSAGIVSIPMVGIKGSLNVSAAFAIVMASWFQRRQKG